MRSCYNSATRLYSWAFRKQRAHAKPSGDALLCMAKSLTRADPRLQCPQGTAAAVPCAAGRYSNSSSLKSNAGCSLCPRGSWCPQGAERPSLCKAGRYGATPGQSSADCTGPCMPGHFCEEGSFSNTSGVCRELRNNRPRTASLVLTRRALVPLTLGESRLCAWQPQPPLTQTSVGQTGLPAGHAPSVENP